MKIIQVFFLLLVLYGCTDYSQVTYVAKLPKKLKEVSGLIKANDSNFWMHNDGGNKNELYLVSTYGKIVKTLSIKAKNTDWEDITSDEEGNIYLADFGNNNSTRKDLTILKIKAEDLVNQKSVEVEKIEFEYPEQYKFPPKKGDRHFDAESILYFKNHLYIFTKSRVKNNYGKTSLYRLPTKAGKYQAELIGKFDNCSNRDCWITGAAISDDNSKVALLTSNQILLFTNFKADNFFSGKLTRMDLGFSSQKEAIDFMDNNTLYFSDERSHSSGGNLYSIQLVK
ncbi:hypothetical protein ACOSP6_04340 [Tenacibaculum sp. MEBiC06402]|uniref:hypothetical protein n=1 Tax=unclassified Tenacibaculum TaxID=2635139 RepID=UPI003B996CA7